MSNTEIIELNRKHLSNGHVVVSYKANDQVYYDEYLSEQDVLEKNKRAIVSRAYAKKNKIGRNMLVYIDPNTNQNAPRVLKTLVYDRQNKLSEETVFNAEGVKVLSRFYQNGILEKDWTFDGKTGRLISGIQYRKNTVGKYDIISLSTPIYNENGELSHTIQKKTNEKGVPTGEILQRVFYLCNLPFVRVSYTEDKKNPLNPSSRIYSLDEGKWNIVTDKALIKHLIPILEEAVSCEGKNAPQRSFLDTHSNIHFSELTYDDVLAFKKLNPTVQILTPEQIGYIPSEDEKFSQLENLTVEERQFVEKALNAGYYVSLTPLKEA